MPETGIDLRELEGSWVWRASLYGQDGQPGPVARIRVYPGEQAHAVALVWAGGVGGHPWTLLKLETPDGAAQVDLVLTYDEPGVPAVGSMIV